VSGTAIRAAISFFLIVLVCLCVTGLSWTSAHQPPPKALASQIVLGIAILSGLVGLAAVWRGSAARV
jgi:hypothetical protein